MFSAAALDTRAQCFNGPCFNRSYFTRHHFNRHGFTATRQRAAKTYQWERLTRILLPNASCCLGCEDRRSGLSGRAGVKKQSHHFSAFLLLSIRKWIN